MADEPKPEERARIKIDEQLADAGWHIADWGGVTYEHLLIPDECPRWFANPNYNGTEGIPEQRTPTHNRTFLNPLQFDPQTGRWIFHQNTINPNYVRDVMTNASLQEVE